MSRAGKIHERNSQEIPLNSYSTLSNNSLVSTNQAPKLVPQGGEGQSPQKSAGASQHIMELGKRILHVGHHGRMQGGDMGCGSPWCHVNNIWVYECS